MSAINGYADLLVTAGEYSSRNDIAHLFSRFIGMAEMKLNRRLRVGDMEKTATVTLTDGAGPLPTDFIEARAVSMPNGRVLRSYSLQALLGRYNHRIRLTHAPDAFAIVGKTMAIRPIWGGDVQVSYYAAIPALKPSNPTNWLLDVASDIYLYALVEEIAIWAKDVAGAGAAASLKEQAIKSFIVNDEIARFGQNKISIGGPTP